jgi:hypothetical protein
MLPGDGQNRKLEDDMMKKSLMIATFLVVGAGAAGVGADIGTTANLKGSDTLFDITTAMLLNCPGAVPPYQGTGSGNGESAMIKGTQAVAPMSRFLSNKVCAGAAGVPEAGVPDAGPATAQGIVIALDGVSVVGSKNTFGAAISPVDGGVACENGDPNTACDPDAGVNTGAAYNTTITLDSSCGGGSYTFNGWRDLLRVLFAGLDNTPAATGTGAPAWAARDCNSCVRQTIANHYGNFFEGSCSPQSGDVVNDAGNPVANTNTPCSFIRHVFRRDDFSGTTDTVVGLLNLPSVVTPETTVTVFPGGVSTPVLQHTGANPFCNAVRPGFVFPQSATSPEPTTLQSPDSTWDPTSRNVGTGFCQPVCTTGNSCVNGACVPSPAQCAPPCAAGSICSGGVCVARSACAPPGCLIEASVYRSTMQDNDPIRRTCAGAGNIPGAPAEDVCSNSGDLGLVLPMNDVPENGGTNGTSNADRYNATPCAGGAILSAAAPDVYDAITQSKIICARGALCPAGDICLNTGACLVPTRAPVGTETGAQASCLASKVSFSGLPISSRQVPAVHAALPNKDKRAFNQHLYKQVGTAGAYQVNAFATPLAVTGAYYRIHTNHSLEPVVNAQDGGPLPEEDGGVEESRVCQHPDMTDQIGCLVEASPCSIGYAGRGAANNAVNDNLSTNAIKINKQDPIELCITGNDAGITGFTYPLARKLYLNTIRGFANISGPELQLAGCETDLAQSAPPFTVATPPGLMTDAGATSAPTFGFINIPGYVNGGEPYCEDFNENMLCSVTTFPVNTNACATAPTNFSAFPAFNTVCGDGIQDPFEDCDCGTTTSPASSPATNVANCGATFNGGTVCTTTCRSVQ